MKNPCSNLLGLTWLSALFLTGCATAPKPSVGPVVTITSPMAAPEWAKLERQLLAENVPACREFFQKYFDDRGYLQCVVRWGADDGADDAFENFNRWPELHALGASDEIKQMFMKGHEGMIKQYTEAKTTEVPVGRGGMYYKEFNAQSDWMHHGEGLQLFNRMGLSMSSLLKPSQPSQPLLPRQLLRFTRGRERRQPWLKTAASALKLVTCMFLCGICCSPRQGAPSSPGLAFTPPNTLRADQHTTVLAAGRHVAMSGSECVKGERDYNKPCSTMGGRLGKL